MPAAPACFWGSTTLTASSHEPGYRDQFRLRFIWEISARFPRWAEGQWSWGRVLAPRDKKADMRNTKIINFAPIIAFATLKAVSLQLTGMLMMGKIQQAMQDDSIWARIHPAFIPLTGMKSHMAKFPARLPRSRLEKTEISGTEPACSAHMNTSR